MSERDILVGLAAFLAEEAADAERCRADDQAEGRAEYASFDDGRLKQLERISLFLRGTLKLQVVGR